MTSRLLTCPDRVDATGDLWPTCHTIIRLTHFFFPLLKLCVTALLSFAPRHTYYAIQCILALLHVRLSIPTFDAKRADQAPPICSQSELLQSGLDPSLP